MGLPVGTRGLEKVEVGVEAGVVVFWARTRAAWAAARVKSELRILMALIK